MITEDFEEVTKEYFSPLGNEGLAIDLAKLVNEKKKHISDMSSEELCKFVKPLFEKNGETWDEPTGE